MQPEPFHHQPWQADVQASRQKLLDLIKPAASVTFIRGYGNLGDELIYAGTRQLLRGIHYQEVSVLDLGAVRGELGLLAGSGAWCKAYHDMTRYVRLAARQFDRLIVLPSSYDTTVDPVRQALRELKATFFARERESYQQIQSLCDAALAHDGAFYFDYTPYRRPGKGVLTAYRTDSESRDRVHTPAGNSDISLACESLDEWLWTIARHQLIRTDRAHVMIAGALLGKTVECWPSNYHKIPALLDFSLKGFPVRIVDYSPGPEEVRESEATAAEPPVDKLRRQPRESLARAAQELASLLGPGDSLALADNGEISKWPLLGPRALPFPSAAGQFGGPPADDAAALAELNRVKLAGVPFLAVAWPAFWWLEFYTQFYEVLRNSYPCVLENERLKVFKLRSG